MTNPRHAGDSIDHLTTARGLLAYPRTPDDYLGAIAHALVAIAHALVAIAERLPAQPRATTHVTGGDR